MGCNAWNHPPGCNCGWGGDTGGSFAGVGYKAGYAVPVRHAAVTAPVRTKAVCDGRWQSVGNRGPNAECPVCGQLVYFVQLENGGRVFFDELGPPWPKHPCTDNGHAVFAPPAYVQHHVGSDAFSEWHLLTSRKFGRESGVRTLKGYCLGLNVYVMLTAPDKESPAPRAPLLVKRDGDTGTYLCSYLAERERGRLEPVSERYYPIASLLRMLVWDRAFEGDPWAENSIGWHHSFFWNNVKDGAKFKNASVAEFWFSRAAAHASPEGRNNLAVLLLDRAGDDPSVLSKAWAELMLSALEMTPTAFGHLGRMLKSGYGGLDRTLLGGLLEAVGRQLTFAQYLGDQSDEEEDEEDEEDEETEDESDPVNAQGTGVRYSPLRISAYFHIETARNIAGLSDYLPAWNFFWLSVDGAEPGTEGPEAFHYRRDVPGTLVESLAFDLDRELGLGVTLRDALRMHPRRFLHFFESADMDSMRLSRSPGWRDRVIRKAKEAADRLPETAEEDAAKIISLPRKYPG